jgi:hypothetical protein
VVIRKVVRDALRDEWMRSIREQIEDTPDGHVERLTDAVMRALEDSGSSMESDPIFSRDDDRGHPRPVRDPSPLRPDSHR